MNSNKLNRNSRIILFLSAILLIVVLFVPMWSIQLNAPQYPEGLGLSIYANKLGGDVDIINGLNHYIGMKTLQEKDFPEFIILPYCIVFFSLFFAVTAILAYKKLVQLLLFIFISFGVLAMADFWRWEYNYGHDLNPAAAIKVPGMSYQPPLIGYKQLLNFGAFSMPDIGGWIFIIVGLLLLGVVIFAAKFNKKKNNIHSFMMSSTFLLFILSFFFVSCNSIPPKIRIGKDYCAFCRMTVTDHRFGAVFMNQQGKPFIFDDLACLVSYIHSNHIMTTAISSVYFTNFIGKHELIKVENAILIKSKQLQGPMNGQMAAFINKDSCDLFIKTFSGNVITWDQVLQ
jgi:copper chaperone NosL